MGFPEAIVLEAYLACDKNEVFCKNTNKLTSRIVCLSINIF